MPSWKDLRRFCQRDGWELYRDTDHYFYRKRIDGGDYKKTKVSKGPGQINGHKWNDILKKQLQVSIKLKLCRIF
jgi:hypothetical protein